MSHVSVIILAAGLGTRMKSRWAKVLHRAGGACLLEHVIGAARAVAAPERITAVVGHQAAEVREAVAHTGIGFQTQSQQHGTGHALLACRGLARHGEGVVMVLYGDCPLLSRATLEGLLARHREASCAATLITTRLEDPTGYGRIYRDAEGYVTSIVEQKAATEEQKRIQEINPGIYSFEAPVLWQCLPALKPNPASGEYYLTDVVELLAAAGHRTATFSVDDPHQILGINTRVELAEVDRILRARKVKELMLAGVTVEMPETVVVDAGVTVGADTMIGPFTQLLGRTVVGEECVIGACSIVENAWLGDGVEVKPFTSIQDSVLEPGAKAGPYARLRMNARLEQGALAGNFVEIKKTTLGAGAKAMHLAYLGDAHIGAGTNIGAGTITCNYDGKVKHPTVIGEHAFIGSNSTLVAPLEVGAGSYVAAGSVITKPVPEDALAIGRAHQLLKEGWAKRRREQE